MKSTSYKLSLVAVFAAMYYVLSMISPFIPAIGLADIKIQLEALMSSVFGFILGPYLGALASFFGALITWILPPGSVNPYGAPFLLSPPINALTVGLIFYKKWKWASITFGLLIITFLFLPPSQPITKYYYVSIAVLWDKVLALSLILLVPKIKGKYNNAKTASLTIFIISFIGNQADSVWGSDVFALPIVYNTIYGLDLDFVRFLFTVSPFIYPVIRFVQAVIATIIAFPLLRSLQNTQLKFEEESVLD